MNGRKPAAFALLGLSIMAASSLVAMLLLNTGIRLHLRHSPTPSEERSGMAAWAACTALLIAAGYFAGLAWRRQLGPVRSVFPVLLAVLGPVLAFAGVASFYYPISWPAWIDSELVGATAIVSGGTVSVLLAPSFLADRRSWLRLAARSLLCLWGALIVVAGTWSVLFLE